MGWQERFKQGAFGIDSTKGNASFRGVPFFLESNGATFGKRLAEHEFPQRNTPFVEELGSAIKRFSVEGYFSGDDHLDQRDSMLAACATAGSGILIHPYYGKLTVICKDVSPREETMMLRKSTISFNFVEAGEFQFSTSKKNTAVNVLSKVDAAYLKLDERFRKMYQIAGIPFAEAQQLQKVLNLAVTEIANSKKVVGRVAEFSIAVNTMANTVFSLFNDPIALIQAIINLTSFGVTDESVLGDVVIDNGQAFTDIKLLFTFTPTRTIPSVPADILVQAMQISGVVAASGIMSKILFKSVEDAQAARITILDKIDELVLATSPVLDDDLFIVLSELRVAVSQDVDERSLSLSRLTTYTVNQALPSLVIANALYGSIDQEEDIIARNKVRHPGFLGPNLQVLLNA